MICYKYFIVPKTRETNYKKCFRFPKLFPVTDKLFFIFIFYFGKGFFACFDV